MRPGSCRFKRLSEIAQRDGPLGVLHHLLVVEPRRRLGNARDWLGDAVKAFLMLLVLRPAADLLPAGWAHGLADLFSVLNTLMPFYGLSKLRLIRKVFSVDRRSSFRTTRLLLSQPLHDSIFLRRVLRGRESADQPLVEVNAGIIEQLRQTRSSFILATGHFARTAAARMYLPRIVPQRVISLANPPIEKSCHPHELWLRYHYGQIVGFPPFLRPEVMTVNPGQVGLIRKLVGLLGEPGNALVIAVDAPCLERQERGVTRPFASLRERNFATGAATLSRITQRPIALCIPYLETSQQIVVEWVKLIPAPGPKDLQADRRITNDLLDQIELAIAKRPWQYVIDYLGQRKWDEAQQCWEKASPAPLHASPGP